jgi:hypothetical protein
MPTYTFYGDVADDYFDMEGTPYAVVREADPREAFYVTDTHFVIGQQYSADFDSYTIYQADIAFDTTGLPENEAIESATIAAWLVSGPGTTDFTIEVRQHDWGTTVDAEDWLKGSDLDSKPLLASLPTTSLVAGYNEFAAEDALVAAISPTGVLRAVVCSDHHRLGTAPTGDETATFNSADAGGSQVKLVVVTSTPAFNDNGTYASSTTTGTTLSIEGANTDQPIGRVVIVAFAMDPATGTVSCADNQGNTYTLDKDVTNGSGTSGVRLCVFRSKIVAEMTAFDTITVTHPSCAARAMFSAWFDMGAIVVDTVSADATGTSDTPSADATATADNVLLIGAIGVEGSYDDTFTEASGWTSVITAGATPGFGTLGGAADSNITVYLAYKIDTVAGAKTYTATIGTSRLWADALVIYRSPGAKKRMVIASVNEGTDAYHLSLDYDQTSGAASKAVLEPLAQPGQHTAVATITLADGTTTRTLTAQPPGNDTGGEAYLDVSADGLTVTPGAEGDELDGTDSCTLDVSPFEV